MMKKALTMDRPYTVLEKKLQELEARFTELLFPSQNLKPSSLNPISREKISKEIQPRVDFLKTLLMAEKDCRSYGAHVSVQLGEIEERLEGLEVSFGDWMEGREISQKDFLGREIFERDDLDGEILEKDGFIRDAFFDQEIQDGFNGEILQKDYFSSEIFDQEIQDAFNGERGEKEGSNREISDKEIQDFFNGESVEKRSFNSEIFEQEMQDAFNGKSLEKEDFNGENSTCFCTSSCFSEEQEEENEVKDNQFELEVKNDLNIFEVQKGYERKFNAKRPVRNRYCGLFLGFVGTVVTVLGAMVGIWMRVGDFEDEFFVLPPT